MIRSIIVLEGDVAHPSSVGVADAGLRASFQRDALELAARIPAARAWSCAAAEAPGALLAALAHGPAVALVANVPHLPLWRLRDAFTRLEDDADVICGPDERLGWYLLGLRPSAARLVAAAGPLEDSLARLVDRARATGLRVVSLPGWYRLVSPADLERLADDLRPMPATVAAHTRAAMEEGLRARAVGG